MAHKLAGVQRKVLNHVFRGKEGVGPIKKPLLLPVPAATINRDMDTVEENIKEEVENIRKSIEMLYEKINNLSERVSKIENMLVQQVASYAPANNQKNTDGTLSGAEPITTCEKTEKVENEGSCVLSEINVTNPKVIQIVLDWMQFLVERVGHAGAKEILQYYMDIKWISAEVAEILQRYADGIRVDIEPETGQPAQLDPEDHMKSLEYILQIKEFQNIG